MSNFLSTFVKGAKAYVGVMYVYVRLSHQFLESNPLVVRVYPENMQKITGLA